MKIFPILFIVFFVYATIGVEFLNEEFPKISYKSKYYDNKALANFNDYPKSFLILFQIATQVNWNIILFEYTVNSNHYYLILLYFTSFHLILVIIIQNLLKGLIYFKIYKNKNIN